MLMSQKNQTGSSGCCVDVVAVAMEGDGGSGATVKWTVLGWPDWSTNANCVAKAAASCSIGFG